MRNREEKINWRERYQRLIDDEETLNRLSKKDLVAKLLRTQEQLVNAVVNGHEDYDMLKEYMNGQFDILTGK